MTTSNEFTSFCTGNGRHCKPDCLAFSLVHIAFPKNLVYLAYAYSAYANFSTEFYSLLNILVSPSIS